MLTPDENVDSETEFANTNTFIIEEMGLSGEYVAILKETYFLKKLVKRGRYNLMKNKALRILNQMLFKVGQYMLNQETLALMKVKLPISLLHIWFADFFGLNNWVSFSILI